MKWHQTQKGIRYREICPFYVKETTNGAMSLPGQCSERWIPTHTSLTPSAFQISQPSIRQDLCIGTMSEYGKFEDHQTSWKDFPESQREVWAFNWHSHCSQFFEEDTVCQTNFLRLLQEKSFLSYKQGIPMWFFNLTGPLKSSWSQWSEGGFPSFRALFC